MTFMEKARFLDFPLPKINCVCDSAFLLLTADMYISKQISMLTAVGVCTMHRQGTVYLKNNSSKVQYSGTENPLKPYIHIVRNVQFNSRYPWLKVCG